MRYLVLWQNAHVSRAWSLSRMEHGLHHLLALEVKSWAYTLCPSQACDSPQHERTRVFVEMPGSDLVCTNLGPLWDFRELLASSMVLGSDKLPWLSWPLIQGMHEPCLSANAFIMCCLSDSLGSESRLFTALCFSSNKGLLEIIKPGLGSAWQGQLWSRAECSLPSRVLLPRSRRGPQRSVWRRRD